MHGVYVKKERDWWEFFKKIFLLFLAFTITVGLSCLDVYTRDKVGFFWSYIQEFFCRIGGGDTIFFAGYTMVTLLAIKIARNTIVFMDKCLALLFGLLVCGVLFLLEWNDSGLFRLFWGIIWGIMSKVLEMILDYV